MSDQPILRPVPETLHVFDVYRMPVRFEDDKARSRNHYVVCVVVHEDGDSGWAVKLTSNPKWHDVGDIQLADWGQAGLSHLTTARCAQVVRFRRSELQGWIGRLSRVDARRVIAAFTSIPPEKLIWL